MPNFLTRSESRGHKYDLDTPLFYFMRISIRPGTLLSHNSLPSTVRSCGDVSYIVTWLPPFLGVYDAYRNWFSEGPLWLLVTLSVDLADFGHVK